MGATKYVLVTSSPAQWHDALDACPQRLAGAYLARPSSDDVKSLSAWLLGVKMPPLNRLRVRKGNAEVDGLESGYVPHSSGACAASAPRVVLPEIGAGLSGAPESSWMQVPGCAVRSGLAPQPCHDAHLLAWLLPAAPWIDLVRTGDGSQWASAGGLQQASEPLQWCPGEPNNKCVPSRSASSTFSDHGRLSSIGSDRASQRVECGMLTTAAGSGTSRARSCSTTARFQKQETGGSMTCSAMQPCTTSASRTGAVHVSGPSRLPCLIAAAVAAAIVSAAVCQTVSQLRWPRVCFPSRLSNGPSQLRHIAGALTQIKHVCI